MDEEGRCSRPGSQLSAVSFNGEHALGGDSFWQKANMSSEERIHNKEPLMKCQTTEWILWAIAMIVFLWLMLSGRTRDLGLAIAAVAVLWYVIVPALSSGRE
jgi:hypothetical protein